MKIITASTKIEDITPDPLKSIEAAARVCYQSIPKDESSEDFIRRLIKRGHMTPLEMAHMRVRVICDRGVSHELVRHRLCSFNQESTRYVWYDGEMEFIRPVWFGPDSFPPGVYKEENDFETATGSIEELYWIRLMWGAEKTYQFLIDKEIVGKQCWTPEQARSVLPNSLKTELIMTANLREWMHIFKLRCSPAAHPQMREIMIPLREKAIKQIPSIFETIGE